MKRTTEFFYVYYVVKIITATITDGGLICLALSYLVQLLFVFHYAEFSITRSCLEVSNKWAFWIDLGPSDHFQCLGRDDPNSDHVSMFT